MGSYVLSVTSSYTLMYGQGTLEDSEAYLTTPRVVLSHIARPYERTVSQHLLPKPNLRIRIPRPTHRTLSPTTLGRRTLATSTRSRRGAELDAHLRIPHLQRRHRSWLRLFGRLCVVLPSPGLDPRLCRRRHRCNGRRTCLVELLWARWGWVAGLKRCLLLAE